MSASRKSSPRARAIRFATMFVFSTAVAGCGGGGGSSAVPPSGGPPFSPTPGGVPTPAPSPTPKGGATPGPGPGTTPPPTPVPTATPVATPTPSSSTASVSGRVTDDSGLAVAGAKVYVGSSLPRSATPISSGALATTAADGSFTVSGVQNANTGPEYNTGPIGYDYKATWIVIWPKDSALPVYHVPRTLANPTGANALGAVTLVRVSADDIAGLAAMNSYRAAQGSPPLALDETLVEAARYWAAYVVRYPGTGHSCVAGIDPPDCINAQGYESVRGERGAGENLGPASTTPLDGGLIQAGWGGLLAAYESEAAKCPQPAQYTTCAAYQQTLFASGQLDLVGHWINLVNPSLTWAGLALVPDARPGNSPGSLSGDNEFGSLL